MQLLDDRVSMLKPMSDLRQTTAACLCLEACVTAAALRRGHSAPPAGHHQWGSKSSTAEEQGLQQLFSFLPLKIMKNLNGRQLHLVMPNDTDGGPTCVDVCCRCQSF
ncbi:unnamed protein product [Arctogadus glacialis]